MVVLIAGVAGLAFRVTTVVSTSMSPTLRPNQRVVLLRMQPPLPLWRQTLARTLQRGDLVVLRGRRNETQLVKRLVALGGDRVSISEGLLFLNEAAVQEPYARHGSARLREADAWPTGGDRRPVTIPTDLIFVLGDNRSESSDSRLWGPVPISDVVAKVVLALPQSR